VSSIISGTSERCRNCGQELPGGQLACPHCHQLVHAEELNRLAASAKELEAKGELRLAREQWIYALALLPRDAEQAAWIRAHARTLLDAALDSEAPSKSRSEWAKRLGPLAPLAVVLAKFKGLLIAVFKFKFLLSLFAFIGVYWALFGMKFGIGFAALILIHELGHYVDIKRRGLPAEMPVFLPGLGAYVKWQALGVSLETRAAVSLAGPMAGWLASVACVLVWLSTRDPLWAALARAGAWLNVLNLIPVAILDGGQAASALGRTQRFWLVTVAAALGILFGEGVFFLVAAGAVWRLFTKDQPAQSSAFATAYYVTVLVLLGGVLRLIPGHGFGVQ
jgi:Zn-dependent protease